jgi:cell division septation protein DedD
MKRKVLAATSALMVCATQAVWTGSTPPSRMQLPGVRANPPIQALALPERPDVPDELWTSPEEPPAEDAQESPEGPYFVQAGLFSKHMRALLLVAAIEPKYPDAFISTRRSAGAQLYQVGIGPFLSRTEAEDAADWLESLGHDALILRTAPAPAARAKKPGRPSARAA